jgi:undecaprenyl-phosphate 4-deoxy-4-formamido-L-arabinose transferase
MGVILFGIGLLGEYIGRVYLQVRARPRYVIQAVLQKPEGSDGDSKLGESKHQAIEAGRPS